MLWEVIKYIKDMLIYKTSGDISIYSNEEKEKIKELVKDVSIERLIKIINELSELENSLKWSTQRNLLFETGIIKLSSNFANSGYDEIEKRLQNIEEQLKSGKLVQNVDNISTNNTKTVNNIELQNTDSNISEQRSSKDSIQEPKKNIVDAENAEKLTDKKANLDKNNTEKEKPKSTTSKVSNTPDIKDWKALVDNLKANGKMMLYTNLVNTTAKEINDMTVGIVFKKGITPFGRTVLEKPENMQYLIQVVSQMCGKEMRIKLVDESAETNKSNDINGDNDMPFNIIN